MDSLIIRPLVESDYDDILVGWWKQWDWDAPPRDFLPDDGKGGIMIMDGDTPVCAGFLYVTNSKASWVDWIISNKEYNRKPHRKEAITLLISKLTEISKNLGNKYAYALIKNKNLIKVYTDLGYANGDSYSEEMIKLL